MKHLYVYIGRFQPFHDGHESVVLDTRDNLMEEGDKFLLITGSNDKSGTSHDPFTTEQRHAMINEVLKKDLEGFDYSLDSIDDEGDDYDKWIKDLKKIVREHTDHGKYKPVIVGHDDIIIYARKAGYSFHLSPETVKIHGTDIRRMLLSGKEEKLPVPEKIKEWLDRHNAVEILRRIANRDRLRKMSR